MSKTGKQQGMVRSGATSSKAPREISRAAKSGMFIETKDIKRFVEHFYGVHGKVMSKLAHE